MNRAFVLVLAIGVSGRAAARSPDRGAGGKKSDAKAWDGANSPRRSGWKPATSRSWEQQMRACTQGQNEYSRGRR
jgi:hypothetical protein